MTRFARAGDSNKKKPNEASSWQDLKKASFAHKHSTQSSLSSPSSNKNRTAPGRIQDDSRASHHSNVPISKSKSKFKKKFVKSKHGKGMGSSSTKSRPSSSSSGLSHVSEQNSKSLIEELEEMDRQQMLAIQKEEKHKRKFESEGELQKEMNNDGTGNKKMDKKDKRREERRLKRQNTKLNRMVCYHCREAGHGIADCPRALMDAEQGTGVCYRCGSTEHDSSQCTARIDPNEDDFPFAKCFICQEMGHLSKSCPDNPKGLYPMGGCCQYCESVEHMSWNCPHNKKLKGPKEVAVATYSNTSHQSADAEVFEAPKRIAPPVRKKPKVVKF